MKETIEKGIIPHLEGQISLHKANIEIYMKTPAGIGDHPCICLLYTSDAADE